MAGLVGERAQGVEGVGVARVLGKDLAEKGFGFAEAPGFLVGD